MSRILLVDDDRDTLDVFSMQLRSEGFETRLAPTGREAVTAAKCFAPQVALIDLVLPDLSGIEVARQFRRLRLNVACVLVTGHGTFEVATEAVRAGMTELASKPLAGDALLAVVRRAMDRFPLIEMQRGCEVHDSRAHALRRWAVAIARTVRLPEDPRTEDAWARGIATSKGALRSWCFAAGIQTRSSLLFARVLRALIVQRTAKVRPEDLLDIIDQRTLKKLVTLAGGEDIRLPGSVERFLDRQSLICNQRAIDEVRMVLQGMGLTLYQSSEVTRGIQLDRSAPTTVRTMILDE